MLAASPAARPGALSVPPRRPIPKRSSRRPASLLAVAALAPAILATLPAAHAQKAPAPIPATPVPATPAAESLEARLLATFNRPGGLTAEEVGRRAAATSPDVRARQQEVAAAAATVDQTIAQFLPRISGTARYVRLSDITPPSLGSFPPNVALVATLNTTAGAVLKPTDILISTGPVNFSFPVFLNQTTFQGTLQVPLSDYVLRLSNALAASRNNVEASRNNAEAARLKAATDGKTVYYNWARARMGLVVGEQAVAQARAHLTDAQHAFEAGTVSKADVLRVESQVAQAELLVARTRDVVAFLEEQLRIVMHQGGGDAFEIGEDLGGDVPPVEIDDREALEAEALRSRLELRALGRAVEALRSQASLTRAGYYPRLDAFGDLIYQNPNQRIFPQTDEFKFTWDVGAQLTWSPNDLLTTRAQAHGADARVAQTEAQAQLLRDGLRAELAQAIQAIRDADAAMAASRRGLVAAEESYRVRKELYTYGRATNVELLDAESDVTRARLESINARVDLRLARVRLEHALGRDVGKR